MSWLHLVKSTGGGRWSCGWWTWTLIKVLFFLDIWKIPNFHQRIHPAFCCHRHLEDVDVVCAHLARGSVSGHFWKSRVFFYFVYLPRQIKTSLQNFQTLKPIDYFLFIENKTNPTPRPRPFIPSVFIAASFSRRIRMLAIFARLIFGRGVASSTERVGALSENHFFFKILKS